MWADTLFKNKKPVPARLLAGGFVKLGENYIYSAPILDGFLLTLTVRPMGGAQLCVTDTATDEEYTLIHNENAVGAFVGQVRAECERVMAELVDSCFEENIFKTKQARLLISHIEEKFGSRAEFLWEDTPNNAIFRGKKRWFAVLMTVKPSNLGLSGEGEIEIINLKAAPERVEALVREDGIFKGFHMNKKHWYSVLLDGPVPTSRLFELIDGSFASIGGK